MSEHMNSDEYIQSLYNQTKHLRSPSDLDDLILSKIHAFDEQPKAATPENLWLYLPLAASILVVVLLQFRGSEKSVDEIQVLDVAQLPAHKKKPLKLKNIQKNQLPELYFLPSEDINNKVVPACTGGLVTPEDRIEALNKQQKPALKEKTSHIPIQQIYPVNSNGQHPKCDSVSRQVFKK